MKTFIKKILYTLIILFSVFLLGIFIPLLISLFIFVFTEFSIVKCISSVPFWIFTILGWIISSFYVNGIVKESNI